MNALKECEFCGDGSIVLAPHLGNLLTASCNVCENTYVLKDIASYHKLSKKCEKCQGTLIKVLIYF